MKRFFLFLVGGLALTSCYKDLGNYDYNFDNMNHIDVESIAFTPSAYLTRDGYMVEIQQPRTDQVRKVDVSFDRTLGEGAQDLEFFWSRDYRLNGQHIIDTVYTKGYVEVTLPANTAMTYNIRLIVTDPSTTLQYYSSVIIKTRPAYKNSLMVLHGEAGDRRLGNVEQIGPLANVVTDAFEALYPETEFPFVRDAVALMYAPCADLAGQKRRMAIFSSDGTGCVWDPYGLSQPSNLSTYSNYCFPNNPVGMSPRYVVGLGDYTAMKEHKLVIDRSGQFYVSCQFLCFWQANFAPPLWNPKHQNDYTIEMGTIMPEKYVLWDSKYQRFLVQSAMVSWELGNYDYTSYRETPVEMRTIENAYVDFSALGSRTPVGKKAVYAFIKASADESIYMDAHPLFIFQDPDTGKFFLYDLALTEAVKDGKLPLLLNAEGEEIDPDAVPLFTITAKELVDFTPDNLSNIVYSHSFSTNYIFFTQGPNVYRYNTGNGEVYTVYEAPEGYKSVSTLKFRTTYDTPPSGFLGRYLDIALLKEDNTGAVVSLRLDTSGDLDESYNVRLYDADEEGRHFGRIADIAFVHDYLMEQEMYEADL